MKAARIHGLRDVRIEEVPAPEPAPGDVLLRVRAIGICGSDLHYYLEGGIGPAKITSPMTPGHEFAAEVIDGTGELHGLADGTLVAADPAQNCGACEHCEAGYPNLCPKVRFLGSPGVDGGMCEFLTAPGHTLFPIPTHFGPTLGALLEPLGVAIHALDVTKVKPMTGVAVVGGGPIGLMIAQVAKVAGAAHVRVVEPNAFRREAALELGADSVHADYREVLDVTGGRGEDVVIEATNSGEGPEHACRIARIGGRVTLVGIPDTDAFTLNAANVRRKGLTIKLSRRMGRVYPRAIALVEQGRVNIAPIATHAFPLERADEAFARAAEAPDGMLKAMVIPG
jgi:L-iditol 2-dehydrogenase